MPQQRVGKLITQQGEDCWLAAMCMAMGWKYNQAKRDLYWPIVRRRTYEDVTEQDREALGWLRSYWEAHEKVTLEHPNSVRDTVPPDAHGIVSVRTRTSYNHSVAVVDGRILDSGLFKGEYPNLRSYLSENRIRPTEIIYEEHRP